MQRARQHLMRNALALWAIAAWQSKPGDKRVRAERASGLAERFWRLRSLFVAFGKLMRHACRDEAPYSRDDWV